MDISPSTIDTTAAVRTPSITESVPTSTRTITVVRTAQAPESSMLAAVPGAQLTVDAKAEMKVDVHPPPLFYDGPYQSHYYPHRWDIRASTSLNVNVVVPALQKGMPENPRSWSVTDVSASAGSPLVVSDPPPPPSTGFTCYVWEAADLPAVGSDVSVWPEANGGPSWLSRTIYQPSVVFSFWPPGKGLLFTYWNVEHMWLDIDVPLGSYTVMIDAILISYPTAQYGHYILDAGKAPDIDFDSSNGGDYWMGDEGLSTRSVMLYRPYWGIGGTNNLQDVSYGTHLRPDHDPNLGRHRVFYSVFNGGNSRMGSFDHDNWYTQEGPYDSATNQYFVLGRRQSRISDNFATHMVVSEVRIFSGALSWDQLVEQYKSMATKYDHGLGGFFY